MVQLRGVMPCRVDITAENAAAVCANNTWGIFVLYFLRMWIILSTFAPLLK